MKQIIAFLSILLPFSLFSQINETFDGPQVTSKYPWVGDIYDFYINKEQQLVFLSIPDEAGEASLFLKDVPCYQDMVWEMEVMLDFKPTNSNNARLYLFTDTYNVSGYPEQYYIQVGNNSGQVSLYRQDTGNPVLCISGRRSLLDSPYTKVYIRLSLSRGKEWILQTRTTNEPEFITEGVYTRSVSSNNTETTFILTCRYIKSRLSGFYFDNLAIYPLPEDPGPPGGNGEDPEPSLPELQDIRYPFDSQLELIYTQPVEIQDMAVTVAGVGEAERTEYGESLRNVLCFFPFSFQGSKEYEIQISGLKSATGKSIPSGTHTIKTEEKDPGYPTPEPLPISYTSGMILINEIMANPKGLTELPETEYVELYNTTETEISLKDWVFYYGTQKVILPDKILSAGKYAVLYREGRAIHVDADGMSLSLSNFPGALSNTGKELMLLAPDGTEIDEVTYERATPAKSWEREGNKWNLSSDPRGGTPGSVNTYTGGPSEPSPSGEEVQAGDIIFNELLPNPYPDGSEFIEFYNRSGTPLFINGLSVAIRKADGTLATHYPLTEVTTVLPEEGYLVITKDKNGVTPFYSVPDEEIICDIKMPVLNNSSSTLVLFRSSDQTVIDEITYSSKWHSSSILSEKGVSLERINPEEDTQNQTNWASASGIAGYATPGYQNSQFMQSGDQLEKEEIGICKPVYHPDGTYSIPYQLDKSGYYCKSLIYSLNGMQQGEVANHVLTGTSGAIPWDGMSSSGNRLSTGLYILYVEFYHPEGDSKKYKIPFPVR